MSSGRQPDEPMRLGGGHQAGTSCIIAAKRYGMERNRDASTSRDEEVTAGATRPRGLTAGCLFSGMGGFASGLIGAGFEILWANDNDPYACKTFRHRFPRIALLEKDVCDLSVSADGLRQVDLLAGGFPCQSFSQAGERRGFDDERGRLFFEIGRLLTEMDASGRRPRLILLENVPYLLYGADGRWFDEVRKALRKAGYWFRAESCWIVNVKDATDVPQDRERLFMDCEAGGG